jgi:uncharacterized protein (TIRG00374 family)
MDIDVRGAVVGFLVAAVVLGALVFVAGTGGVLAALATIRYRDAALLTVAALGWLLSWGLALRTVLGVLGVSVSPVRAFLLYAGAAFSNNVTPFGQAGGEPFSALLISRSTDSQYQRGLAAIASVDALNFVPSVGFALLGIAYYAVRFTVGDRLLLVVAMLVALAAGVSIAGYAVWRFRERVEVLLARVVAGLWRAVAAVVPRFSAPDREAILDRIRSFFADIERVARSRRDVAAALGFSAMGWLCMTAALWVPLAALADVPAAALFAAALIAVPVGGVASLTPLPGGLGGVEFAVVLVLVPVTGLTADTATAGALVYRAGVYWLPTFVGAGAVAWLGGDR